MTADITYLSAFLAGLISFITPCVLPLVPPYLCYMGGVSLESLTSSDGSAARLGADADRHHGDVLECRNDLDPGPAGA